MNISKQLIQQIKRQLKNDTELKVKKGYTITKPINRRYTIKV